MRKELRELLQQLEQQKQEIRNLIVEDKTDEAEKRMPEVRSLQKKIEVMRSMDEGDDFFGGQPLNPNGESVESREDAELETEYNGIFLRALRRQPVSADMRSVVKEYERRALMNEGGTNPPIPAGDTSLLVPKDVQTRINSVIRSLNDLTEHINVVGVNTLSGTRVMEKDQTMTPFPVIEEYGLITEMDNPQFVPIEYKVKKRGGILPLTNELLADSDQNVIQYVTDWIGRKAVVTRNTLITQLLNTMPKVDLPDFGAVKKVLNVSLDPAISLNATILTNQDGYNWLDQLVDNQGRPLLTDDITQPGRKMFKGRPIAVASNRYLPSDTVNGKAPIIIGDLKQLIVLFSRKFYELASTKEGGDAFKRDTTDLRAIMRDDIKFWDEDAAIFGQLDISDTI